MRRVLVYFCVAFLVEYAIFAQQQTSITLKHSSEKEQQTKVQLEKLLKKYSLSKWMFTREIIIDGNSIPHSHPILTLHTRHLGQDDYLLSTFIHEQIHWFFEQRRQRTESAIRELKVLYPQVPVGFPTGADSEESSYEHLLVCYSEFAAMSELLGEEKANSVMEFWSTDHYTWIYKTILKDKPKIKAIVEKNALKI